LRFSDYIFTQIFDWQHKILFDENDYAIDLNYRQILLKSAQAINKLSRYRELPSNAWMAGDVKTHARRFQSDNKARATVQYLSNHGEIYLGGAECIIEITASNDQKSLSFESELLDLLTDFISAPIFYCPHHPKSMLRQLDSFISDNARSQIKHLCHTPIADEMVERIVEIGRHFSFENAVEARVRDTPEPPREEWIGGTKWGVRMKLVHIKNGWIRLDKIEVA
jgi:hypothetical protein